MDSGHSNSTLTRNRRAAQTRRLRDARRRRADEIRRSQGPSRPRPINDPNKVRSIDSLRNGDVSHAIGVERNNQQATAWRDARPDTVHLHLDRVSSSQVRELTPTLLAMADDARSADQMGLNFRDRLVVYVNLDGVDDPAAVQQALNDFKADMEETDTIAGVEIQLNVPGVAANDIGAMRAYLTQQTQSQEQNAQNQQRLRDIDARLQQLADMDNKRSGSREEVSAMRDKADELFRLINAAKIVHPNPEVQARRNRPLDNAAYLLRQRIGQLEQNPSRDLGQYGRTPTMAETGIYAHVTVNTTESSLAYDAPPSADGQSSGALTADSPDAGRSNERGGYDRVSEIEDNVSAYQAIPADAAYDQVPPENVYGRVEQPQYQDVPVAPDPAQSIVDDLVEASKDGNNERSDNREYLQIVNLLRTLADLEQQSGQVDPATLRIFMARIQALRAKAESSKPFKPGVRERRNQALREMDRRLAAKLQRLESGNNPNTVDRALDLIRQQGLNVDVIRQLFDQLSPDEQQALLQNRIPADEPLPPQNHRNPYEAASAPLASPYDAVGDPLVANPGDRAPSRSLAPNRLRYEDANGDSSSAHDFFMPPQAPITIARDLGPNPMLYFQPNADGGMNFRVDNPGIDVGWIQVERFCSILATHWLTNGQPARLAFNDLNDANKIGAIDLLSNWAAQGGLNAQVQHAKQALGEGAVEIDGSEAVRADVENGNLPPGSLIWFATNQHAQAALVQRNGDELNYLVFDPNKGGVEAKTANEFRSYIQMNNKFVVKRG